MYFKAATPKYEHKQEKIFTDKGVIRYLRSSHAQLLTAKWLLSFWLVQSQ